IVGLSFATVLTLIVVPVTYSLLDDLERVATRYLTGRRSGRTGEFAVVHDTDPDLTPVQGSPRVPDVARPDGTAPEPVGA
ncbi:MAG: hypothetical protein OEW56_09605, partial [Gemmatimonadota bacterium]|nr:hypothetical protein [Gemmatimonadota bacterium]